MLSLNLYEHHISFLHKWCCPQWCGLIASRWLRHACRATLSPTPILDYSVRVALMSKFSMFICLGPNAWTPLIDDLSFTSLYRALLLFFTTWLLSGEWSATPLPSTEMPSSCVIIHTYAMAKNGYIIADANFSGINQQRLYNFNTLLLFRRRRLKITISISCTFVFHGHNGNLLWQDMSTK